MKGLSRAVVAALLLAGLTGAPALATSSTIPSTEATRTCVPAPAKIGERQADSGGHPMTYRETYYSNECRGFDRVSGVKLDIWTGGGCAGTFLNLFGFWINGWRLNPDTLGDWNPPEWSRSCVKSRNHYSTLLRPGGDHYVYLFHSMPLWQRCSSTAITVDWRHFGFLPQRDQHYRTEPVCWDGR